MCASLTVARFTELASQAKGTADYQAKLTLPTVTKNRCSFGRGQFGEPHFRLTVVMQVDQDGLSF